MDTKETTMKTSDQSASDMVDRRRIEWRVFADMLRIVRHAASSDETHFSLNAVYLEREGDSILATATDGHRLAQARTTFPVPPEAFEVTKRGFLLSLPDVDRLLAEAKRIAKLYGKHRPGMLRVEQTESGLAFLSLDPTDPEWLTVESMIPCKPIDGEFPNYRQVIPTEDRPEVLAAFNASYLADAAKALGMLGIRSQAVKVGIAKKDGDMSPARITASGIDAGIDAVAIVMPMRI